MYTVYNVINVRAHELARVPQYPQTERYQRAQRVNLLSKQQQNEEGGTIRAQGLKSISREEFPYANGSQYTSIITTVEWPGHTARALTISRDRER